jgi:hypothetical protein
VINKVTSEFDFEMWAELAQADPEAFELKRQAVIDDFLTKCKISEERRHRLQCLQWRINVERNRASNPMDACVKINRMMWDAFAGEQGLIAALQDITSPSPYEELVTSRRAKVIPFVH